MARNSEKAQTTLNRLLQHKQDEARGPKKRRPFIATECNDLNEADRWRQQILREVGKKVMEIQNAGLGEHRIRDLNDEINKLIREKGHWERRIAELGGPDYTKLGPKVTDASGLEIADSSAKGAGGYKYFGAARQLPGVKELFEREAPRAVRRTRHQMNKAIDPDYYGFRDEEDGILEKAEAAAQELLRAQAILEWEEKEHERAAAASGVKAVSTTEHDGPQYLAYVPLPDQRAIEQRVLEKKKNDLMAKYTSESLLAEQSEAKALLNKRCSYTVSSSSRRRIHSRCAAPPRSSQSRHLVTALTSTSVQPPKQPLVLLHDRRQHSSSHLRGPLSPSSASKRQSPGPSEAQQDSSGSSPQQRPGSAPRRQQQPQNSSSPEGDGSSEQQQEGYPDGLADEGEEEEGEEDEGEVTDSLLHNPDLISGYTPANYISYTNNPDHRCFHEVSVKVDAPPSVCFELWNDWCRLVDFLDLIGQIGLDPESSDMGLFQCFYRWGQLPVMEIVFVAEKKEVRPNQLIKFESVWGMPLDGAVVFTPSDDEAGTVVGFALSHQLPKLLVDMGIGVFGVETQMRTILTENMLVFKELAESLAVNSPSAPPRREAYENPAYAARILEEGAKVDAGAEGLAERLERAANADLEEFDAQFDAIDGPSEAEVAAAVTAAEASMAGSSGQEDEEAPEAAVGSGRDATAGGVSDQDGSSSGQRRTRLAAAAATSGLTATETADDRVAAAADSGSSRSSSSSGASKRGRKPGSGSGNKAAGSSRSPLFASGAPSDTSAASSAAVPASAKRKGSRKASTAQ